MRPQQPDPFSSTLFGQGVSALVFGGPICLVVAVNGGVPRFITGDYPGFRFWLLLSLTLLAISGVGVILMEILRRDDRAETWSIGHTFVASVLGVIAMVLVMRFHVGPRFLVPLTVWLLVGQIPGNLIASARISEPERKRRQRESDRKRAAFRAAAAEARAAEAALDSESPAAPAEPQSAAAPPPPPATPPAEA